MKKILLVCSAGMSTSLLVTKMEKEAEKRGIEVEIEAVSNSVVKEYVGKCDVCLIGPQMKFNYESVKETLKVPTEVIDMRVYGLVQGDAALDQALALME